MSKRKGKSREYIDDSDDSDDTGAKSKKKTKLKQQKQAEAASVEDEMIQLSAKRFVNVRTFKDKILVDIREYYEDDNGERKPGKKGISLSLEQWEALKDSFEEIDSRIQALKS